MSFEQSLKGGHPNSLGNTLKMVDAVLVNTDKMVDLFLCYQSDDETVRLRPDIFKKWKKRFIKEIAETDQPLAKWISDFCKFSMPLALCTVFCFNDVVLFFVFRSNCKALK